MKKANSRHLNSILTAVLILLLALFAVSLFKNIQYPLMWMDEADTAMFARRILLYGVPKVHDGKNIINPFYPPNFDLAVNNETDTYLYQGWATPYFATLGEKLASLTDDIYLKTATLRIPFAIIGFIGIIIFGLSVVTIVDKNKTIKLLFLSLFFFLSTLSISLILHLREVRYYSPVIFFSACIFYIYFKYKFQININFVRYCIILIILLLLAFNTYYPVYFIFILTIGVHESFLFLKVLKNNNFKLKSQFFLPFIPIIISLIFVSPLLLFYNIPKTSAAAFKLFGFGFYMYKIRLLEIIVFFNKFEILPVVIIVKIIKWFSLYWKKFPQINQKITGKNRISDFLGLFFIIYVLLIAINPIPVFTRYYIVLLPILYLILVIDIFILYDSLIEKGNKIKNKKIKFSLGVFFLFILILVSKNNLLQKHIYELSHQYKGPLDYIIPYIKENFKDPKKLTIATDYEETSYMYYLDSKVIIGYVGNNLENDMKVQPDIIAYRAFSGFIKPQVFFNYLQKAKYKAITFPITNYPINNIPDFTFVFPHQFKTRLATNDKEKLTIFVRDDKIFTE